MRIVINTYAVGLVGWAAVHVSTGWQGGWRRCAMSTLLWPRDAWRMFR